MTRRRWAALAALAFLLLCSCATGPTAADVAADRDRWRAVRDTTADRTVDALEAPLLGELLAAWDAKLTADEAAVVSRDTTVEDLLRVYGAAAVQLWLVPEFQRRAPEMFRLVDRNGDGVLDETELRAIDPKSPVFATVVLMTAAQLLAKHRG